MYDSDVYTTSKIFVLTLAIRPETAPLHLLGHF